MRVVVVSLLVAAAGWLVVPAAIRRHRQVSVTASVAAFQQHLGLLATRLGPGHATAMPRPQTVRRPAARRVLVARWLFGTTLLCVLPAAFAGGWWWVAPLASGTLYAAHLTLVHRLRRRAALRAKVQPLPVRRPAPSQPALVRAL